MDNEQYRPVSAMFIQELTRAQLELRVYVVTLLGDANDAADVLQETNLDLWKKAATFDLDRPFLPWAKRLAWFQVLKFRSGKKREKVIFSEEVLNAMVETMQAEPKGAEEMLDALENCVKKLTDRQRAYLVAKYAERQTVEEMAAFFRHTTAAIVSVLYRLRNALHECVEKSVQQERA